MVKAGKTIGGKSLIEPAEHGVQYRQISQNGQSSPSNMQLLPDQDKGIYPDMDFSIPVPGVQPSQSIRLRDAKRGKGGRVTGDIAPAKQYGRGNFLIIADFFGTETAFPIKINCYHDDLPIRCYQGFTC